MSLGKPNKNANFIMILRYDPEFEPGTCTNSLPIPFCILEDKCTTRYNIHSYKFYPYCVFNLCTTRMHSIKHT